MSNQSMMFECGDPGFPPGLALLTPMRFVTRKRLPNRGWFSTSAIPIARPKRSARKQSWNVKLKSSKRFRKHFSLVKVGTQFPVGLFRGEVATKNQVFPGGSAAIDLIAQDEQDCLCLFELKAGMNIPAGIISELLFCTWVMQDAMTGHFQFGAEPSAEKGEIKPVDIRACKTIKARFIGNKFHPLLDGGDILAELNKAGVGTSPAVRFGLTEVVGEGEPFHFKDSP